MLKRGIPFLDIIIFYSFFHPQETHFVPAVFSVVRADDDEVVTRVKGYIGKLFLFFHVFFHSFYLCIFHMAVSYVKFQEIFASEFAPTTWDAYCNPLQLFLEISKHRVPNTLVENFAVAQRKLRRCKWCYSAIRNGDC